MHLFVAKWHKSWAWSYCAQPLLSHLQFVRIWTTHVHQRPWHIACVLGLPTVFTVARFEITVWREQFIAMCHAVYTRSVPCTACKMKHATRLTTAWVTSSVSSILLCTTRAIPRFCQSAAAFILTRTFMKTKVRFRMSWSKRNILHLQMDLVTWVAC